MPAGLALVRLKRREEAVEALRKAAELEPGAPRDGFALAVALEANLARHSRDRDTLTALVTFLRVDGDATAALAPR